MLLAASSATSTTSPASSVARSTSTVIDPFVARLAPERWSPLPVSGRFPPSTRPLTTTTGRVPPAATVPPGVSIELTIFTSTA